MSDPAPETTPPQPSPGPASVKAPELELALDLDSRDVGVLRQMAELNRFRGARARTTQVTTVWHDSPDAALEQKRQALEETRAGQHATWRITRLRVAPDKTWVPGSPSEILAEASHRAALGHHLPDTLIPVVAFEGSNATVRLSRDEGAATMTLEKGLLRAVAAEREVCRVVLRGPPATVLDLALAIARAARASVPARSLAAAAIELARPPRSGEKPDPPLLSDNLAVGDAFAHVLAHLTATLLALAPGAAARDGMEPVHQMRVAVRRLRSAMSLFQRVTSGPELDVARGALRGLGRVLGPARDWDVFTEETTARLDAFAEDAAVRRLLVSARRRRAASYAALRDYLEGPEFRVLGVRLVGLAALRPWQAIPAGDDAQEVTLSEFAAHQLARLRRKMRTEDADVGQLPAAELHALRIHAKRLRYAAEFFAPLFPGKAMQRYIRRVSAVQAELGVLNDGVVTTKLVAELGRAPGYAAGVVAGDVAARAGDARGSHRGGLAQAQPRADGVALSLELIGAGLRSRAASGRRWASRNRLLRGARAHP